MSLFRRASRLASKDNIDKAKGLAAKNADKISGTVDKATSAIDQRTKGKYRDKLDKVDQAVERGLDKAKGDVTETGHEPTTTDPADRGPTDSDPGTGDPDEPTPGTPG